MRILGLDLGVKSLGMCVSDSRKITITPLKNLKINSFDEKFFLKAIKDVIHHYPDIKTIVLGYPTRMTGTKSEMTFLVEDFFKILKLEFNDKQVVLIDERMSSKTSVALMKEQNLSPKKIKKNKDMMAACFIVKKYIDENY